MAFNTKVDVADTELEANEAVAAEAEDVTLEDEALVEAESDTDEDNEEMDEEADESNSLIVLPCGRTMPSGINLSFERLSPSHRQVGYVLLTRAPVAIKLSKLSSCCPSTCMC